MIGQGTLAGRFILWLNHLGASKFNLVSETYEGIELSLFSTIESNIIGDVHSGSHLHGHLLGVVLECVSNGFL